MAAIPTLTRYGAQLDASSAPPDSLLASRIGPTQPTRLSPRRVQEAERSRVLGENDGFTITGVDGIDFAPGSDVDVDLLTVLVTGTPRLYWEEGQDRFSSTHGFNITGSVSLLGSSAQLTIGSVHGVNFSPGSDQDVDLLSVLVTGGPTISWDESENRFTTTRGLAPAAGASFGLGTLNQPWPALFMSATAVITLGATVTLSLSGAVFTLTGATLAATLNTAAQPNVTSLGTLTSLTVNGALTVSTVNGIDVNPGSDVDADLLTVGVTGTPRVWWDESEDAFAFTHPIDMYGTGGLTTRPGSDIDHDILVLGVTGVPTLAWDESADVFTFTHGIDLLGGFAHHTSASNITASTTQTQGQQPLTAQINEVLTVANANDVVTMPSASSGMWIYLYNGGANVLQVFPASGDNFDRGTTNASITLATATGALFFALTDAVWRRMDGP